MKTKIKKLLALALAVLMAMTLIGCAKEDPTASVTIGDIGESLTAEKVGNVNRDDFMTAPGGLYYKEENGKYGIMSIEGRYDTGAIYTTCVVEEMYFAVSVKNLPAYTDVAGLNGLGLVDSRGKVLVPMNYVAVDVVSDRYARVVTVTAFTSSKDNAVLSYNTKTEAFSIVPGDDNQLYYAGTWQLYDFVAGRLVPGVSGTSANFPSFKGDFITFKQGENYVTVDKNGTPIAEDADLFEDGSYAIEGKIGEVFDSEGKKLFGYDLTGFVPDEVVGEQYIARKYTDGVTKYAVMDLKGNIISAEFNESFEIYGGEAIFCGNKIYNFEGKQIIEGSYTSMDEDILFGKFYMLRNSEDDTYTIAKRDGTIIYTAVDEEEYFVYPNDFVAHKKVEAEDGTQNTMFYSHKAKDYTINGYSFAPWLIKTPGANGLTNVVDSMTGNTLFEGYSAYSYSETDSTAYYVYAKYNGGADVYLIIPTSRLAEVTARKNALLDELIAAFKAEGITVTINKETGEMSMDSSVLFGGDSAVLTAAGKTFLNKFIKVYTGIAFSSKYEGFISKTMVEGHAAPLAGSTYASGLPLSEERAANVKAYCLSSETGVDVSKLSDALQAVGYSNSQPIYNADGTVNLEASRRVSFRFMVNVFLK